MAKRIYPLGNRIAVKRHENDETKVDGIIVTRAITGNSVFADVMAVPEQLTDADGYVINCPVEVGDVVVISKYDGPMVDVSDGEIWQLVKLDEIFAVVESD